MKLPARDIPSIVNIRTGSTSVGIFRRIAWSGPLIIQMKISYNFKDPNRGVGHRNQFNWKCVRNLEGKNVTLLIGFQKWPKKLHAFIDIRLTSDRRSVYRKNQKTESNRQSGDTRGFFSVGTMQHTSYLLYAPSDSSSFSWIKSSSRREYKTKKAKKAYQTCFIWFYQYFSCWIFKLLHSKSDSPEQVLGQSLSTRGGGTQAKWPTGMCGG